MIQEIFSFNDSFKNSLDYYILINFELNMMKCNASDFERIYTFYKGNCYRFNGGKDSNGNLTEPKNIIGIAYGLKLELMLKMLSIRKSNFD